MSVTLGVSDSDAYFDVEDEKIKDSLRQLFDNTRVLRDEIVLLKDRILLLETEKDTDLL